VKYKCVACVYLSATGHTFQAIDTSRSEVERLISRTRPAVVGHRRFHPGLTIVGHAHVELGRQAQEPRQRVGRVHVVFDDKNGNAPAFWSRVGHRGLAGGDLRTGRAARED